MKNNAHLYLPWSVIAELVASTDAQLSKAKSDRPRVPVPSAEALDGGCVRIGSQRSLAIGQWLRCHA
jgi:hypothetical protein